MCYQAAVQLQDDAVTPDWQFPVTQAGAGGLFFLHVAVSVLG